MRTRVVLIKGFNLGELITIAPFERINVDHIAMSLAMRLPQLLPIDMSADEIITYENFSKIFLEHLRNTSEDYRILSEYVMTAEDRNWENIKAVEGCALDLSWFFETVKSLHKSKNQSITEVIAYQSEYMVIDDKTLTWNEGIRFLSDRRASLG